jgi:S1-C subfamily serine protease/uncharacterized membrane protein required for colicin V production
VTLADVVVALLAVAAAGRGWARGLLGQAFEFGGGFVGLVVGVAVGPRIAAAVAGDSGLGGALLALVVVLIGLSIGQVFGYLVGQHFGDFARTVRLGGVDSALGSLFGVAVTLVAYWLLGSLLVEGPIPVVARELGRSRVLRALNGVATPPDVLSYLRHYLDTSDFPPVFAHLPRAPAAPVALPRPQLARRIARAASSSTVRVRAPACDARQLGSGWIAARSTVVTNAHVVAGGDDVMVAERAGEWRSGRVVLFDAATDVAVLRVTGLSGAPLELAAARLHPGAVGVTLGYPGSGGATLDVGRAAVKARFFAEGLDIYERSPVRREVYELLARVRQGDSGGPFVVPGGKVAGVVFAASTTDGRTGYALTADEVADEVRAGARATGAVSTGGCLH